MRMKNLAASFAVVAMALMSVGNARGDTITFQGGNLDVAGNWLASDGITTGFPVSGDTGIVNVDSTFPGTGGAGTLSAGGDLVFGGGSTLTATIDVVANVPDSVTFNDVTVNAGDDIFTGGGNFIFNSGSVTNVDDDFEANAGGTLTINGGTHNVGIAAGQSGTFGVQGTTAGNASDLFITGGDITALEFEVGTLGELSLGGTAVLTGGGGTAKLLGLANITSDWTGSWTISDLTGTDWATEVIDSTWSLDGTTVDATIFANSFVVDAGGTRLSLVATAVPEPTSVALLGLAGLGVMFRRRKQSQVA